MRGCIGPASAAPGAGLVLAAAAAKAEHPPLVQSHCLAEPACSTVEWNTLGLHGYVVLAKHGMHTLSYGSWHGYNALVLV